MLTMVGLGLLVILATAATTTIAQQLPSGHFHIIDFQGRCVDYVPTSTNNFVPIVTNTCVNGTQSQIVRNVLVTVRARTSTPVSGT